MNAINDYLKTDLNLKESELIQLNFDAKYHMNGVDYIIATLTPELSIGKTVPALLIGGDQ